MTHSRELMCPSVSGLFVVVEAIKLGCERKLQPILEIDRNIWRNSYNSKSSPMINDHTILTLAICGSVCVAADVTFFLQNFIASTTMTTLHGHQWEEQSPVASAGTTAALCRGDHLFLFEWRLVEEEIRQAMQTGGRHTARECHNVTHTPAGEWAQLCFASDRASSLACCFFQARKWAKTSRGEKVRWNILSRQPQQTAEQMQHSMHVIQILSNELITLGIFCPN